MKFTKCMESATIMYMWTVRKGTERSGRDLKDRQ